MRPSSAKAKGRIGQQKVRDELLSRAPELTANDIRSTSMGASGVDILLSEAAIKRFPFAIEVKCQEALNVWSALEQAELTRTPKQIPVLFFKRNRSEMYVALTMKDFLDLTSAITTKD